MAVKDARPSRNISFAYDLPLSRRIAYNTLITGLTIAKGTRLDDYIKTIGYVSFQGNFSPGI